AAVRSVVAAAVGSRLHGVGERRAELRHEDLLEAERRLVELARLRPRGAHVRREEGGVDGRDLHHCFSSLAIWRSWSWVWSALLDSWNERCASMRPTSDSPMSTSEPSRLPCTSCERVTTDGRPLPVVGTRTPPSSSSSAPGFGTRTSVICPIFFPATSTEPSGPIWTSVGFVPAGTVIGGTTRSPEPVTSEPLAWTWKSPARVRPIRPGPSW